MIYANATDLRFIVFSETGSVRTIHSIVNTVAGAKRSLTNALKRKKITEPSYGWQRQEMVDGAWIDC